MPQTVFEPAVLKLSALNKTKSFFSDYILSEKCLHAVSSGCVYVCVWEGGVVTPSSCETMQVL